MRKYPKFMAMREEHLMKAEDDGRHVLSVRSSVMAKEAMGGI